MRAKRNSPSGAGCSKGSDSRRAVYLSFVVPCHNELENFAELYRRIDAAAGEIGDPFELVLVNDGSTDGTWSAMRCLAAAHSEVVAINLSRCFGQQAALAAGLSIARGENVITLDADLQDPPELVREMLAKRHAGADVVHARRRSRAGESFFKRASAAAFYRLLNWLSETHVECDSGEFRLFSRRAVDCLKQLPERHRLLRGLAGWIGFQQTVVEYDRPPRARGKSKFALRAMLRLATDATAAFSIRPLRLASIFCIFWGVLAVASAGCGLWAIINERAWSMWAMGATLICAQAAIQLMALAVIGEYLGRLFDQQLGRPLYIVEEVIGGLSPAYEKRPRATCPK